MFNLLNSTTYLDVDTPHSKRPHSELHHSGLAPHYRQKDPRIAKLMEIQDRLNDIERQLNAIADELLRIEAKLFVIEVKLNDLAEKLTGVTVSSDMVSRAIKIMDRLEMPKFLTERNDILDSISKHTTKVPTRFPALDPFVSSSQIQPSSTSSARTPSAPFFSSHGSTISLPSSVLPWSCVPQPCPEPLRHPGQSSSTTGFFRPPSPLFGNPSGDGGMGLHSSSSSGGFLDTLFRGPQPTFVPHAPTSTSGYPPFPSWSPPVPRSTTSSSSFSESGHFSFPSYSSPLPHSTAQTSLPLFPPPPSSNPFFSSAPLPSSSYPFSSFGPPLSPAMSSSAPGSMPWEDDSVPDDESIKRGQEKRWKELQSERNPQPSSNSISSFSFSTSMSPPASSYTSSMPYFSPPPKGNDSVFPAFTPPAANSIGYGASGFSPSPCSSYGSPASRSTPSYSPPERTSSSTAPMSSPFLPAPTSAVSFPPLLSSSYPFSSFSPSAPVISLLPGSSPQFPVLSTTSDSFFPAFTPPAASGNVSTLDDQTRDGKDAETLRLLAEAEEEEKRYAENEEKSRKAVTEMQEKEKQTEERKRRDEEASEKAVKALVAEEEQNNKAAVREREVEEQRQREEAKEKAEQRQREERAEKAEEQKQREEEARKKAEEENRSKEAEKEECPLCLEVLNRKDKDNPLSFPPCLHPLHPGCFSQIMKDGDKKCPTCRRSLQAEEVQ